MDPATVGSVVTVLAFVAFVAIVIWAYGPRRRERFERDGRIPFDGDDKR